VKSIKYPFKYIHKGGDCAMLEIDKDEIKTYIDGRYIGPPEAAWRIFHFDPHTQIPNVVRLPVHLATYDPGETLMKSSSVRLPRSASLKLFLPQIGMMVDSEKRLENACIRSFLNISPGRKLLGENQRTG
jgi:hypothetical protein